MLLWKMNLIRMWHNQISSGLPIPTTIELDHFKLIQLLFVGLVFYDTRLAVFLLGNFMGKNICRFAVIKVRWQIENVSVRTIFGRNKQVKLHSTAAILYLLTPTTPSVAYRPSTRVHT